MRKVRNDVSSNPQALQKLLQAMSDQIDLCEAEIIRMSREATVRKSTKKKGDTQ